MKKNPLIVIFLTVFIDLLGFSIVIPILAPLLALPTSSAILPDMGFEQRLILFGFLVASYPLAQFFGAPLMGQLSDKYGRKPLLAMSLIGTLVARIVFIVGILNKDIYLLFASRIVDGLTGGNITVAQSAIADISTPKTKSKNFGLIGAAFGLGFIIGPYLGGRFGDIATVNWFGQFLPSFIASSSTLPLWVASILCLFNIILLFLIFPETVKNKADNKISLAAPLKSLVHVFKLANLRVILLVGFLITLGFTFFTQYLSVYVQNKFESEIIASVQTKYQEGQITIPEEMQYIPEPQKSEAVNQYLMSRYFPAEAQTMSSDLFSYIGFWVVIAQGFLARFLANKVSSQTQLKFGLLVNSAASFLFLFPNQFNYLYLIVPFFALSNGLVQPNLTALISNSADNETQGQVLGGNQSIQSLAQAMPPIISGYITSVSIAAPVLIASLTTLFAAIIFMRFYHVNIKQKLHEE
jgi:DHA1 family tetracycline resistance protein-like MFS transporter